MLYAQLNIAYDYGLPRDRDRRRRSTAWSRCSATAAFAPAAPIGTVTFTRRAGAPGSITIPAGTPVTDAADKIRYETTETRAMLAGE